MRAFIVAMLAIIGISCGAYYAMNHYGQSTAEAYATDNVRLGN